VEGLTDESDFQRFVNAAKQRSSHRFAQERGEQLWQTSYFDHTLRPDEKPREVMRYIITNPVRAGIVCDVRDYEYWGSQVYGWEELLEYVGDG
jgi:REP element-mobilizing transposase RayT